MKTIQPKKNLGIHVLGIYFLGIKFLGIQILGIQFLGIQFLGIQFLGIQFLGIQFRGIGLISGNQIWGPGAFLDTGYMRDKSRILNLASDWIRRDTAHAEFYIR